MEGFVERSREVRVDVVDAIWGEHLVSSHRNGGKTPRYPASQPTGYLER